MKTRHNLGLIADLTTRHLPAIARHGSSGQCDTSHRMEVSGTVTRIRLGTLTADAGRAAPDRRPIYRPRMPVLKNEISPITAR